MVALRKIIRIIMLTQSNLLIHSELQALSVLIVKKVPFLEERASAGRSKDRLRRAFGGHLARSPTQSRDSFEARSKLEVS